MFMTWSVGWAGSRQTCVVGNSGATVMCCRRGTGAYGKASHIPPMQVARVTARFPPAHRATKPPHSVCAHQPAGPELLKYGAGVQSPSLGAPWGLEGEASAEAAGVQQRGLHGVPEKVLQVHRPPGEIRQCVKWASL